MRPVFWYSKSTSLFQCLALQILEGTEVVSKLLRKAHLVVEGVVVLNERIQPRSLLEVVRIAKVLHPHVCVLPIRINHNQLPLDELKLV